jgi:hypothetical protein
MFALHRKINPHPHLNQTKKKFFATNSDKRLVHLKNCGAIKNSKTTIKNSKRPAYPLSNFFVGMVQYRLPPTSCLGGGG